MLHRQSRYAVREFAGILKLNPLPIALVSWRQVFDSCSSDGVDADFVYFGCGLHLLQLIPDREMPRQNLHT